MGHPPHHHHPQLLSMKECSGKKVQKIKVAQNDPPHLPHGHLPIVGVGVVVPLDGSQVGVEVEENVR